MKGDFSRRTFDAANHYSAVLIEQGRMLTDADLEEEHRILGHRIEREAADLIGGCGGPIGNAGFAITENGAGGLTIGGGRYYVGGILVENDDDAVPYDDQPDRYDVAPPPLNDPGTYLVVLDVWRRLITAIDDPAIREVALGGPTTSARERTVWQVRLEEVAAGATCLSPLPAFETTTGSLAAQTTPVVTPDDPCLVPPTAGFKGLENQLYRVEIHDSGEPYDLTAAADSFEITGFPAGTMNRVTVSGGSWTAGEAVEIYRAGAGFTPLAADLFLVVKAEPAGTATTLTLNRDRQSYAQGDAPRVRKVAATFVWSRDNGSVITAIDGIDVTGTEITVHDLGPDDVRGFLPGQWVEIIDDGRELEGLPGALAWVQEIDVAQRIVRLSAPAALGLNMSWRPKLRRWEGAGAIRFQNPAPGDDWIDLEDGIQIRFAAGHYRSGDYWQFPARTATADPASGNIVWPQDATGPALQAPLGIAHHYCPLAIITVTAGGDGETTSVTITDCRELFPPVTELTTLLYVGGDGQEGTPDPAAPGSRSVALDAPLQVRVGNGEHPVAGATVRFAVTLGNGRLQGTNDKIVAVTTDGNGIATCVWQLDGNTKHQQVDANLLNAAGNPIDQQIVRFHASLSRASEVAYDPRECPDLVEAGVKTVQQAIDVLCQREPGGGGCCCVVIGPNGEYDRIEVAVSALLEQGESDLCLCLLPGDHVIKGFEGSWEVTNEDPQRRISLKIKGCGPNTRLQIDPGVILRGLWSFVLSELDIFYPFAGDNEHGWMELDQVREVRVETCRVTGFTEPMPQLQIRNATTVYIGNSTFQALKAEAMWNGVRFFEGMDELHELFRDLWSEFKERVSKTAVVLAERPPEDRARIAGEILERIEGFGNELSTGERDAFHRLAHTLQFEPPDPVALIDQLIAAYAAVGRTVPGVAIVIGPLTDEGVNVYDPGRMRQSELIVENNVISGIISLYGPPQPEEINDAKLNRTLRTYLRDGRIRLGGLSGNAHLRNNHLTRLLIAGNLVRSLEELTDGIYGTLGTLLESLHCTDNVIDGQYSLFVAQHVSLASNNFTRDAYRQPQHDDDVFFEFPNTVIGDSAVYTGNHGQSVNNAVRVTIFDTTRVSAQAANLELTIST